MYRACSTDYSLKRQPSHTTATAAPQPADELEEEAMQCKVLAVQNSSLQVSEKSQDLVVLLYKSEEDKETAWFQSLLPLWK